MEKQSQEELIRALKQLIIDECDRDTSIDGISNNELLFGPDAPLQLDSLDALQLSVALQKQYGVRL
jgi:acyl carrier protein